MTALTILVVGLLLGMKHATEADHLAAVATLAARQTSLAHTIRLGVAWGVGHTVTLMAFAGAVLMLGQVVPPNIERAFETGVGVMLVLLGCDLLRRLWRERIHVHVHAHGSMQKHVHFHSHHGEGRHASSTHAHRHADAGWPLRALAVGMMHGLAGSAALVVLSLQAVSSVGLGLAYIALFGIGSIAGMAALSAAMAVPMRIGAARLARVHRAMVASVGVFSCALGAFTVWEIGYWRALLSS